MKMTGFSTPRSHWVAISLVASLLLASVLVRLYRVRESSRDPSRSAPSVIVHVEGAVNMSGLHILTGPTATAAQALEAAGGCTGDPLPPDLLEALRRREIRSGDLLTFTRGDSGEAAFRIGSMPAAALITLGRKLDPNRAAEEDLSLIPGMKPDFASFIAQRRKRKPWRSLYELEEIPGVGPKTVEKWKEYLEIGESRD